MTYKQSVFGSIRLNVTHQNPLAIYGYRDDDFSFVTGESADPRAPSKVLVGAVTNAFAHVFGLLIHYAVRRNLDMSN